MNKKEGAYVLLNMRMRGEDFKYTFFDTLLMAALSMSELANQPNHDKHIHIFEYSDYLIYKKHLEENTAVTYKECFKIKAIEVEDLDEILNGYKLNLL